jgi:hypothetical protein
VLTYVDAINSGALPSIENTVVTLARRENSAAVQKAIGHYDQLMSEKVQLPTETLQELLDLHRTCEREAIEIFRKHSFKDEGEFFQKELEVIIFCICYRHQGHRRQEYSCKICNKTNKNNQLPLVCKEMTVTYVGLV